MSIWNPWDRRTYEQQLADFRAGPWSGATSAIRAVEVTDQGVLPPTVLATELDLRTQIEGPLPTLDPGQVGMLPPPAVVAQHIVYPLVKLGSKIFRLRPSTLDFSEPSGLVTIDAPGAGPRYEYMGEDEHTVAIQGVFQGPQAYGEVQEIQRQKGGPQVFIYGSLKAPCWIRGFQWRVVRMDWIPYTMGLVIEFPRQGTPGGSPGADTVTSTAAANGAVSGSGLPATGPSQAQGQAATPNPSAPSSADSGTVSYTVKEGDTLASICHARGYSDPEAWQVVATMNGLDDPNLIYPTQVLLLPASDAEEQAAKSRQREP